MTFLLILAAYFAALDIVLVVLWKLRTRSLARSGLSPHSLAP